MSLSLGFRRAMVTAGPYIEFLREQGVPEDVTMDALILACPGQRTRVQTLEYMAKIGSSQQPIHPVVMALARALDARGGL